MLSFISGWEKPAIVLQTQNFKILYFTDILKESKVNMSTATFEDEKRKFYFISIIYFNS